jgi:UDP-glucuronate 4-epimerase
MRFLVTGTAGFIGFHVARKLLDEGHEVVGVDGFTPYYDVRLKRRRHAILQGRNGFEAHEAMLEDMAGLERVWSSSAADIIIHLAAQAGVRYSLENPRAYVDANLVGTFNMLELARQRPVRHFMLASTSSVYGANAKIPFEETDRADHPLTLYAATKKAAELMAHAHAHNWNIPVTAFRFFTVYGPWGRPDMAYFKFTKNILEGTPIDIYNHGKMDRDFTYIDDLVEAIYLLASRAPVRPVDAAAIAAGDSLSPAAPFRAVNIGRGAPTGLMDFIEAIESCLGKKARRNYLPMQQGDVPSTFASTALLEKLTGFTPSVGVPQGVRAFADWYREYYKS